MTNTTNRNQIDPMAALRARALEMIATTPTGRKAKTPRKCGCGCGLMTKGGIWRPGHDAKALSAMLMEMRAAQAQAESVISPLMGELGRDNDQPETDTGDIDLGIRMVTATEQPVELAA